VSENVVLMGDGLRCKHCDKICNSTKTMVNHLLNKHGIDVNVLEHNEWVAYELDSREPTIAHDVVFRGVINDTEFESTKLIKKPRIPDMVTKGAILYKGVIECSVCQTVASNANQMMNHFVKEHANLIIPLAEYGLWETYFSRFGEKEEREEEEHFFNDMPADYKEMYEQWLINRVQDKESPQTCTVCGLEFHQYLTDGDNAIACFLHETQCFADGMDSGSFHCCYCYESFDDIGSLEKHEENCSFDDVFNEEEAKTQMKEALSFECKYCKARFSNLVSKEDHEEYFCVLRNTHTERMDEKNGET
jgi:hypothetical protein